MSDLYRHFTFTCTPEQGANLVALGRFLVLGRETLAKRLAFGDGPVRWPPDAGARLLPPLAFGVAAGVASAEGETWAGYVSRCFGFPTGSVTDRWIEGAGWARTDPTPIGVALRLMYLLDYGTPGDWDRVMAGVAKSDYGNNGFLWDRLDMVPPEEWMRAAGWK